MNPKLPALAQRAIHGVWSGSAEAPETTFLGAPN
jgi:hypothetical protein